MHQQALELTGTSASTVRSRHFWWRHLLASSGARSLDQCMAPCCVLTMPGERECLKGADYQTAPPVHPPHGSLPDIAHLSTARHHHFTIRELLLAHRSVFRTPDPNPGLWIRPGSAAHESHQNFAIVAYGQVCIYTTPRILKTVAITLSFFLCNSTGETAFISGWVTGPPSQLAGNQGIREVAWGQVRGDLAPS